MLLGADMHITLLHSLSGDLYSYKIVPKPSNFHGPCHFVGLFNQTLSRVLMVFRVNGRNKSEVTARDFWLVV